MAALIANCITSARTQKPPEELSAVAGTSCALRSWHRDLARLPFAVLVAAPAPFASKAMCSMGCLQPAGHLETRDQDAKRTRKLSVKSRKAETSLQPWHLFAAAEGTVTIHTGLKADPMDGR